MRACLLFLIACCGVLSLTSRASAEPPSPEETKLLGTAKALLKDLRVERLDNDLKVYLLPIPGAPVVSTMLAYKVGSADELKDQTGLSHYLEHLLFKGTDKLVPGDIDRLTQRNGGRNNAYTSEDMTVYHFDFAADRWKQALEIEADRIRNTRIDEKHEFQQEKGAVISELKGGEDQPWDLELKAILPLLFAKDAPYSHPVIGEEKHVRAATAEIIKRHYDKWYHPNNASLVIVGGFDEKEALELVKKLFGKIPKEALPDRPKVPEQKPRGKQVRHEIPSKFDTARMLIGFNTVRAGEPDDYALDIVDSVLSGGKTSRLHKRLVETDRLANSVGTMNSTGRYPGWFAVQVELLKGKDRAQAEKAVFEELAKLAKEPIAAAELKLIRRRLLTGFIFSRESVHELADAIARGSIYGDGDYMTTHLERLMAVTPEQVQKCAAKYLKQAESVVVWSVPEDDVKQGRAAPARNTALVHAKQAKAAPASGLNMKDAKRTVLDNGLVLITLENHRLPIFVADVHVADVRLHETAKQSGISALVGMMLEEGTGKLTGEQIAELIEATGGKLELTSSGGSLKVLSPDTTLGMNLLFNCIVKPSFPKEALGRKRDQLLNTIAEAETHPQNMAKGLLDEAVYGTHPYGRSAYGKSDIVEKLTVLDCKQFHAKQFVPNRTTVVLVGDFETAAMIESVKKLTADWKPTKETALKLPEPPKAGKPGEQIVSDPSAAQTHVYIGHLGITRSHPDYYKLLVMDNVLGTGPGFTDRLSASLRDRQGLAYTVTAQIASSAADQPGQFIGYIGTFPEKYIWVREGFLKEINRMRDEPATKQEVEDAKKYLLGSLPFRAETLEDVAAQLLYAERYKLGFDYLDTYRKSVQAVTVEDVQAAAKKHLDPKKLTIIAVGPIDKNGKALPEAK